VFTVNYKNNKKIKYAIPYNIPEYVLKSNIPLVNGTHEFVADNLTDWDDLEDFKAKLALRHRYGFSKRIISHA
jgi:hypothetical protein